MIDLQNSFSEICYEKSDTDQWNADWVVPTWLPYFQGHFEDFPVLPAVAIIDGCLFLIQNFLGEHDIQYKNIGRAKFSGIIQPGFQVNINIKRDLKKWSFCWYHQNQAVAEVSLFL